MLRAAERFDRFKSEVAMALITPTCMPPPPSCSDARRKRAEHLLAMPSSLKGAGLTSAVTTAPGAFYASVAAATHWDPDLRTHAPALARFGRHAHGCIMERIGATPSAASAGIDRYFDRTNENSLVLTNFYRDTYINNPKVKLQKLFTRAAHSFANDKHLNILARSIRSTSLAAEEDVDVSDVIAGFTHSMFSSVFYAPLKFPRNRMAPFRFATWVRFFLKLPQPPHLHSHNLRPRVGLSYDTEECLGHHAKGLDKLLDLHANHACGRCVSSYAGMGERHSNTKWCVAAFGREAKLVVNVEPPTHNLLNRGSYDYTPEDVRLFYPKGSTKKHKAFSLELQQSTLVLRELKAGKEHDILERRCQLLKTAISQLDKDRCGLRVDIELRDVHNGEDRWVDTTIIHPTCKSHKKAELKQTTSMEEFQRVLQVSVEDEKEDEEEEEQKGEGKEGKSKKTKNKKNEKREEKKKRQEKKKSVRKEKGEGPREIPPGSAVAKQELLKVRTYSPLIRVATEQFEKGKREVLPVFRPFVLSTLGEMGPQAVALREWITRAYARKLEREGPRADGRKIEHLTADFRSRFRSSIHIAVAKGLARMISSAGFPTTSCAKHTG
jgi:hypothetical protein